MYMRMGLYSVGPPFCQCCYPSKAGFELMVDKTPQGSIVLFNICEVALHPDRHSFRVQITLPSTTTLHHHHHANTLTHHDTSAPSPTTTHASPPSSSPIDHHHHHTHTHTLEWVIGLTHLHPPDRLPRGGTNVCAGQAWLDGIATVICLVTLTFTSP